MAMAIDLFDAVVGHAATITPRAVADANHPCPPHAVAGPPRDSAAVIQTRPVMGAYCGMMASAFRATAMGRHPRLCLVQAVFHAAARSMASSGRRCRDRNQA
jgi:hypothetical protein